MKPRFQFKQFQREDYARIVMHDGAILGHDTGGGKGLALFILPALKVGFERGVKRLQPLAPVLLIVPGDLHQQVIDEGRDKFKATVTRLDSQDTFLQLSTCNPATGKRELPPGYYLTSYTQLSTNGVMPMFDFNPRDLAGMMERLGVRETHLAEFHAARGEHFKLSYGRLKASAEMSLAELSRAHQAARTEYFNLKTVKEELDALFEMLKPFHGRRRNAAYADLDPDQQQGIRRLYVRQCWKEACANLGEARWAQQGDQKLKCVYSPSLADWCQDAFTCVCVDEGVKMKGEETLIGLGVRQLNPAHCYVLTATPIKNRLPDVFRLAWWATGGRQHAHARFPYPDDPEAREEFSNEFLISERNLSAEERTEGRRRFVKRTAQVCNVQRLWKMFAPVILRRRKADFGEDIVRKVRQVVRAPLGRQQAEVYRFHLEAKYKDKEDRPAIGAQLQALRIAAANPASALLKDTGPNGMSLHERDPKAPPPPALARSPHSYIPKLHSTLKLIHEILARGEQVVVFSAFHDSLDALAGRLDMAGVPYCKLDGRTSQKKRGAAAAEFKKGPPKAYVDDYTRIPREGFTPSQYPVMLAGVECMAEGHSFHLCNNVILMCYSWAYDKFEQAINRVHRLNSRWDVNVYPVICENSIDRKLEALIQEKGEAAELVLDGKLALEQTAEVNLAELLHVAMQEFNHVQTVDERELEKQWLPLCQQLAGAARCWGGSLVEPIQPEPVLMVPVTVPRPALPASRLKNPLLARVAAGPSVHPSLADLPLFRAVAA